MVMIVESFPVEDEEMLQEEEETNGVQENTKPTLSKSWTEQSAHAPSYSGGKVTLCNTKGTRNLYGYEDDEDGVKMEGEGSESESAPGSGAGQNYNQTPFLLAPCDGDLTLIDAIRGIKARTIRKGCAQVKGLGGDDYDEEYEDESLDADAIVAYALAPNDSDLITAGRNNILRHYDISGSPSHSYSGADGRGPAKVRKVLGRSGHELPINCIEFHCSGIFFATGSVDGNAKVWDLRGGYATHSFRFHAPGYSSNMGGRGGLRGSITSINWCPDVTKLWLGVGRDDGSVRVHDLRNKDEGDDIVEMTDHVGAVTCMVWASGNGRSNGFDTFFTAGRDAVVNTWNIAEEERDNVSRSKKKKKNEPSSEVPSTRMVYKRVHTLPVYENVEALQIIPNFHYHYKGKDEFVEKNDIVIASGGNKGVVKVWKSTRKQTDGNGVGAISGLKLLIEQEESSAFGEERGGYTGLLLTSYKQQLSKVENGSLSSSEELIAIDAEHNISFLSLVNSEDNIGPSLLDASRTIIGHNDEILDLKIIPNAYDAEDSPRRVAVATNSAQVRLFELGTYSCKVLDGHTETVLSIDVSPCGRYLATAGKDQTMRLWHLKSGKCIAVATGHTDAVGGAALSKKAGRFDVTGKAAKNGGGSFAVTASKDKTLKRWNLPGSMVLDGIASSDQDIEELHVFASTRAHEKDINIVSVAPNDSLIATGSQDKTAKLWRSTDLGLKGTLKGHKRGIWDCQFSKHDRVLATSSGDKTVKLWSLGDFSCVRTFQGHSASAMRVRFLSGGLQLMSCDAEGLMRLWNIRSNECVFTLDAHDDKIWALDLEDDMIVSGGADSRLKMFKDTTKELEEQNREEEEQNILKEQKLANHLRHNEYEQALDIALSMDKPRQVLKVLMAISENDLSKGKDALSTLQHHVENWTMERITQIIKYCREWNTRARNSHISMLTVKAIITSVPADQLACVDGLAEILSGIAPYAQRHFERIDKLHRDSYLIDFALLTMGDLDDGDKDEYLEWEKKSKFVLPPKAIDGRVQIGGSAIVGFKRNNHDSDESSVDSEVLTVGESESGDSSDESDSE